MPKFNLERFLRRIKSPLTRLLNEINRALVDPKRPNWLSLNPHNFKENDHCLMFSFNLKPG